MRPEWTIFDPIFPFSMHLKRTFLMVQKNAAKEVYKYPLEHSVCMEVLTQVWKYVGMYPVQFMYINTKVIVDANLPRLK